MEMNKSKCEICDEEIEGQPGSLSNLREPPRIIRACEKCAAGPDITLYHAGIQVVVDRDDFLRADRERLLHAVEEASCLLEDYGWNLEGVELSGRSGLAAEPLDS